MSRRDAALLRMAVVFVWLATAVASLWEFDGQSRMLLAQAGITDPRFAAGLIVAGAVADLLVGIALLLRPGRRVYWIALALMLAMTVTATALDPALWLHPLGPLTKNVPIAAALWILIRSETP